MNGEDSILWQQRMEHMGSCEQSLGLTHSIGTSSPANEGAGCSEVGFGSTLVGQEITCEAQAGFWS